MAVGQNAAQKSLFDALYCEEQSEIVQDFPTRGRERNLLLPSLLFLEHDLFWDDEELRSLFRKEREIKIEPETCLHRESRFSLSRREAVVCILKINRNHGFSTLTAILAVNYLDRFLSSCVGFQREKPWMMQLAAVACLSLAAKVEETHVPLLLDLQVGDSKYVFEAKTIQRMELLVLSSLKWRMNAVTPLSFLDHIVRRLGLKSYVHWEFLRSCEDLLLSVLPDSRMVCYLPSVVAALATATMLHVIHQLQVELRNGNAFDYENHLLTLLKTTKVQEEVDDCYEVISDVVSKAEMSGCDNESWVGVTSSPCSCISSCSSSSTPQQQQQPIFKKRRVEEQQMKLPSLMSRVFVDVVVATPH
ncbi:cyclin-D3-1 isoform X1 [Sesamum indicum]|uniref:Cyclin-D3-1 isoform X1 n=1 Tax=Sesamum indicum TaxID=4182 RepID=A0A6I9U647_SESIN|nr:cyclin-D3-1 isoform X1 [Sesamum indicum]